MSNVRKSLDGRKRARTMEYIDHKVDISDEDINETRSHIGQYINAQFNTSMSIIDEKSVNQTLCERNNRSNSSLSKVKKRESESLHLQRQMSDVILTNFINDTNKTTTALRGREHILRVMKTTSTSNTKPIMEIKNHKVIQSIIAQRQEKQEVNKPISDFALRYGLIDNTGKTTKHRQTSDFISEMSDQLESLKPTLTKRQIIDEKSPLLRIVKLETVCNQLLCYCQYLTNKEDVVLFLDSNNEQTKNLTINDQIRISDQSKIDVNLPELGSVALGINEIRKESTNNIDKDIPMEIVRTYEFNCSCEKCNPANELNQMSSKMFDLRSTFPNEKYAVSVETIYDSFTFALLSKRIFDLRATIIIYDPDEMNDRYKFIVRDGIGNCLEIILSNIDGLIIETKTRNYVFHQIEFVERIVSPKESNRWPYDDYSPPKKLFSFRSIDNRVSL